jgi:hypothetical protein
VLVVLPGIDVFALSVVVAVSWCLWLDRRPPENVS